MKLEEKVDELKTLIKSKYFIKYLQLEDTKKNPHLDLFNNGKLVEDEDYDFDNLLSIMQLKSRHSGDFQKNTYLFLFNEKALKRIGSTVVGEDFKLLELLDSFDNKYGKG